MVTRSIIPDSQSGLLRIASANSAGTLPISAVSENIDETCDLLEACSQSGWLSQPVWAFEVHHNLP